MKTLLVSLLTLISASLYASPVNTGHLYSENDYKKVITDISFTSIARFGNNKNFGTYELGTGKISPANTKQFQWTKNSPQYFSLEYNSSANLITYSVGSTSLNYNLNDSFTDIFIKTTAAKKGSWISIDNLLLNGYSINDYSYADYYSDKTDYLHISSQIFRDNFILEGYSTMSWLDKKTPSASKLSYEITLVSVIESYGWKPDNDKYDTQVPEPATLILFLLTLIPCLKKINPR